MSEEAFKLMTHDQLVTILMTQAKSIRELRAENDALKQRAEKAERERDETNQRHEINQKINAIEWALDACIIDDDAASHIAGKIMKLEQLSEERDSETCIHNWVSAKNEVITGGYVCTKCYAITAELEKLK